MESLARRALVIAVLAVVCVPGVARTQSATGGARPDLPGQQDQPPVPADTRRTVVRLPLNLFRATFGVFSVANLDPAFIGTIATGFATMYDTPIAEALDDPDSTLGSSLETGGAPLWSGAVVGALFVGGRFAGGTRFRATTYDWLEAYLVTAGYTELVKEITGRTRPNGQDDQSFPSGHASNAFALAVVAERHYGWKVGMAAYGVAAVVGLSRLQQNAHYLSDVLGGATLGYIVGRTVVRVNSPARGRGDTKVNVSPVLARHARAVVVQVTWR
jgi:membrane-associated phospholipid phosphatase